MGNKKLEMPVLLGNRDGRFGVCRDAVAPRRVISPRLHDADDFTTVLPMPIFDKEQRRVDLTIVTDDEADDNGAFVIEQRSRGVGRHGISHPLTVHGFVFGLTILLRVREGLTKRQCREK